MEFNRVLLISAICLGLAGMGYWWLQPGAKEEPPTPEASQTKDVKHEVTDFELVETTGPGEVWTLKSPHSTRTGDTMELESPHVTLTEEDDTTVIITSRKGYYNLSRGLLTLSGDVKVNRVRQNQVLTTEVLNWNQTKGIIETDKVVFLESPEQNLRAVGLWADLSEERIKFKSDVKILSR